MTESITFTTMRGIGSDYARVVVCPERYPFKYKYISELNKFCTYVLTEI